MKLFTHPDRYARRDELSLLDPYKEFQRIYRDDTLLEFGSDTKLGLNLAFYRAFAIPRIAEVLACTGEIASRPDKRSADTGLLMYELIDAGFNDPRSIQVVSMLNRMHRKWEIQDEDYLYILATFIVVPSRWINERAWRQLTVVEMEAATAFYRELGRRMRISNLPQSYGEADRYLRAYEATHLAPSQAGLALMQSARHVFANRLPAAIRKHSDALLAALLDEKPVQQALGLHRRPTVAALASAAFAAQRLVRRRRPPVGDSWFTPGRHAGSLYPDGYELPDLGPTS